MTNGEPYGFESRIGRIEQEQARQDQRLANIQGQVDALTPLMTSVVTLTVEFKNLREDLGSFMKRVDGREDDRDRRSVEADKDRRRARLTAIGFGIALLCALISAFAVILHP